MNIECDVKMKGKFYQNGNEYDMEFDNCKMDMEGNLRGEGADAVGDFTFEGQWCDGDMRFVKQYTGAHQVVYTGA